MRVLSFLTYFKPDILFVLHPPLYRNKKDKTKDSKKTYYKPGFLFFIFFKDHD